MREAFVVKRFRADTLALVQQANDIIAEYTAQGFTLTLRQLYYQFVARDLIPNKQSEYKRLGSVINDARLAGLLDWDAIEDRTRNVRRQAAWDSPQDILAAVANQYKEDPWAEQRWAPEIWIEKDALVGVVEPVALRWRIPFFACRGYTSQSEAYFAGKRFHASRRAGRKPIVFHLGDHDPSGLDMTRDNGDRLAMFAGQQVEVRRLALNMDQVDQYNPPPNPAKDTDSRFEDYRRVYGDESWELDALSPTVIDGLIEAEVQTILDKRAWEKTMARETERRALLGECAEAWPSVVEYLQEIR